MILVDRALRDRHAEGRPIRVGVFGAGFMARGFVNQVANSVPGMEVVAISNRTLSRALTCYTYAGVEGAQVADSQRDFDRLVASGTRVATDDPFLLTRSDLVDCLIDMTGAVEFGAQIALDAFANGKHLVLMNAEVDATIGPLLHRRAKAAGVVLTACDGDQPVVQMNLFRFVTGLGLTPRVVGNVKGLQDEYRNPTTQRGFAERWGQSVTMVTSFADGSKVNFEQALVANATGFGVARRGCLRPVHHGHVDELTTVFDIDMVRQRGGIVDFVVGALPSPGVFCLAEHPDPKQQHYLELFKLGNGPLYSFYAPYHLCHFEAPNSVARAVLFGDSAGPPLDGPVVEVVAIAKRALSVGEVLDSYGEYMTYGQAENVAEVHAQRLLPEGLAEGCRLLRDIPQDAAITWEDVAPPAGRLSIELYEEQCRTFGLRGTASR